MRRPMILAAALLISALASACDGGDEGSGEISVDDLIGICEASRECSSEACMDPLIAWQDIEAEGAPEWPESCSAVCVADGCADISQDECQSCIDDCQLERQGETNAWQAAEAEAQDAYVDCTQSCRSTEGYLSLCSVSVWASGEECADRWGAELRNEGDCADAVTNVDIQG